MKIFLILSCALVLAQGLNVEGGEQIGKEVKEVLLPLVKEYFELNNLIEEVKQYQQTQKIASIALAEKIARVPQHCLPTETPLIEASDTDACQQLQTTLKNALDLGEIVTDWALKTGLTIFKDLYHMTHCGNINPVTAYKCVIKLINNIKDTIDVNKPVALKYKDEISALAKELKVEFKKCFDVHKKTQAIAEQIVVQAQLLR